MEILKNVSVRFTALIDYNENQRIDFECESAEDLHCTLNIFEDGQLICKSNISFGNGKTRASVLLPAPKKDIPSLWQILNKNNTVLWQEEFVWKKPREWTLYYMVSSHTDIGLHNSQYIQRENSIRFLDKAIELNESSEDRYHYIMEGTWFWNNYGMDNGLDKAREVADKYIKSGKIGVCGGIAGNHTQTFGLEEMCRSTYEKKKLFDTYGIETKTMTMIDNNGMTWAMVQPYAAAGYENIIFAPNIWNPLQSTVWKSNTDVYDFIFNSNSGASGSRMDIRYSSVLPMVFYWSDREMKNKLLVWGSTQYDHGGTAFGIQSRRPLHIAQIENDTAKTLSELEEKVPYDIWLFASYGDDQEPSMALTDTLCDFNEKWKYPKFRSLSNPDEPFNMLKSKFSNDIPVICGDLTGGWYQHPLSAAELMADKMEVDRLLPVAEKLAVTASQLNKSYLYPKTDFDRAWDCLLFHDEHSYGTSGYQGRRVYETWMQHRDWINKARNIAEKECKRAVDAISEAVNDDGVLIFNPTLLERNEIVELDGRKAYVENIPSFGYKTVSFDEFKDEKREIILNEAPVIENEYYILKFSGNGSVCSIYDKELQRELLDTDNSFSCNEFVYTRDNHKTYEIISDANFKLLETAFDITVISTSDDEITGAEITRKTTLPKKEKRIDFDNTLNHVSDMWNTNRYYRYCYFAFPFMVKNARRLCHLNGCIAEYGKDVTGHGTDVYMAVRDWCCVENGDFGVALIQKDSSLTEFDTIHPDKTDYNNLGDGSQIYSYAANDWLQMHLSGGKYLDYRFRYSVTSYRGTYKDAGISGLAERIMTPAVTAKTAGKHEDKTFTFDLPANGLSLIGLKCAESNDGIIARFYTNGETVKVKEGFELLKTDETPLDNYPEEINGFITVKIDGEPIKHSKEERSLENPAPIGSNYTGLITEPMAGHTENSGQLYLLWGRSMEEDFSHYELYRSEMDGFMPGEESFVANVERESFRVSRYIDSGLKDDTLYYYRVRAVNKENKKGKFSNQFCGRTREK